MISSVTSTRRGLYGARRTVIDAKLAYARGRWRMSARTCPRGKPPTRARALLKRPAGLVGAVRRRRAGQLAYDDAEQPVGGVEAEGPRVVAVRRILA